MLSKKKMKENKSYIMRIKKDYASLREDLPGWVREIDLIDDDITKWRVVIKCLDHAGPFRDANLTIYLIFGIDYPYKQPVVKFTHQIFHPNIDFTTGVLCTDGKWAVIYDVEMLLFTIRNLLTYPSVAKDGSENPVNIEAAALYSNEPDTYSEVCKKVLEEENPIFLIKEDIYLDSEGSDEDIYLDSERSALYSKNLDSLNLEEFKKLVDQLDDETLKVFFSSYDDNGNTLLHRLCIKNAIDIVEFLISKRIDLNIKEHKDSMTPIHISCINKSYEMLNILIKNGADLNQQSKKGLTVLHLACSMKDDLLVKVLIEKSADVNLFTMDQNTALHIACHANSVACCKLLIEAGINLNHKNRFDSTALHWACKNNSSEVAQYLISIGADIEIINKVNLYQ